MKAEAQERKTCSQFSQLAFWTFPTRAELEAAQLSVQAPGIHGQQKLIRFFLGKIKDYADFFSLSLPVTLSAMALFQRYYLVRSLEWDPKPVLVACLVSTRRVFLFLLSCRFSTAVNA